MLKASLILLALVLPTFAQDRPGSTGWNVQAGAGAIYSPTYLGDDDYQLSLLPALSASYGGTFFASKADGAGFNIYETETLRVGPLLRFDFGREDDGDAPFQVIGDETDDLVGLGDIDETLKLGLFAVYTAGSWSARAEVLQGFGGYDGLTGSLSASYSGPLRFRGKRGFYSVGPRLSWAGNDYTETYFGITAAQSTRSGLEESNADGGITSYGLSAVAGLSLTDTLTLTGILGYTRLTGDAGDSPLVQQRGSEDQFSVGAFLTYSF